MSPVHNDNNTSGGGPEAVPWIESSYRQPVDKLQSVLLVLSREVSGHRGISLASAGLWAFASLAAIALSVLLCCGLVVYRWNGDDCGKKPQARPASYLCHAGPAPSMDGSASTLASGRFSVSAMARGDKSSRSTPSLASSTPRAPVALCPQLLVPDGSKLHCMVQQVRGGGHNQVVQVCSSKARGSVPLFQARVAAGGSVELPLSVVHLETVHGERKIASVSMCGAGPGVGGRGPEMEITTGNGTRYATMAKNGTGGYTIACGSRRLAVFVGCLEKHDMQVVDAQGRTMAEVISRSDPGFYEVVVFPNIDAGLIALGLLAIDKMEGAAPTEPPSTH